MIVPPGTRSELSAVEHQAVEDQLKKLFADPALSQSSRYQQLLKYVVGETLKGNTEALKERTLGIEVFGRTPDYDTVKDPIVRVSVAALRKRINTYYLASEHQGQLRIVVPVGSYVPQFIWPDSEPVQNEELSGLLLPQIAEIADKQSDHYISHLPSDQNKGAVVGIETSPLPTDRVFNFRRVLLYCIAATVALGLMIVVYKRTHYSSTPGASIMAVWAPLIEKDRPPLCAIGQSEMINASDIDAPKSSQPSNVEPDLGLMQYDDTDPLVRIVSHLQTVGAPCRLSRSTTLSLSDLRQGPNILIGAFNNAWTLRLTAPLRFHFGNNAQSLWIEDGENEKRWERVRTHENEMVDYAIIARYQDNLTNEPTLVVAGLSGGGTIAAGQFVTDPRYIDSLARRIGTRALAGNFEVVIETELIDGKPGSPHIVSSYSWN